MAMGSRAPDRMQDVSARQAPEAAAAPRAEGRAEMFAAVAAGHGGRLSAAMTAYPEAPRPWLDLSTGINPEPWTGPRATPADLAHLPDPARLAGLEAVAAQAFGVADVNRVVAVAGAEAGIRLLPRALAFGTVDVVSPTYSSHAAAWASATAAVRAIAGDDAAASAADVLVLVNPNNPDGRTVAHDQLATLVQARAARGAWTVVDESFVETRPDASVADLACDRLIVLRSFGKFYGLPGVRLGFVVAPPAIAGRLRELQGEWPVGAEAIVMGTHAYADAAWRTATEARLCDRAGRFDGLLAHHGLAVVGGTSLFRLAATPDAAGVFARLCRAGVLVRPFAARADWLRFGVPRDEDFARLDAALRQAVR